jgi:phenylalanyl-tRNA synthetase beta chain
MIVSWIWLKEYVDLPMSLGELEERLSLSGLNHEGTESVGDDHALDLEVTSNRPDCLGHIGVAREIAVLWDQKLSIPGPRPKQKGEPVDDLCQVRIDCPQLCYRYTARVIRGVKIGPSPDWLAERLRSVGLTVINNVVDVTNYVLMECGQPLHAFDFAKLSGGQIIVREAHPGELFTAIDHKQYQLSSGTCVIADAENAVALGGVMGGVDSEVSETTTDILLEAAEFDPLSIRTTARRHILHSPSSYRFERGIDPECVDWASRRACELILDLAGGELAEGVVDVGREIEPPPALVLRLGQLERILGIKISHSDTRRILTALGCDECAITTEELVEEIADKLHIHVDLSTSICVTPPSWRRDLLREIDLVEEVGRIYGYDKVPEDVDVPMTASHRVDEDRVLGKIRQALTAIGFDEAMTASVVSDDASSAFSPWSEAEPLETSSPMLRGANRLRRSLVPSLLMARRENEKLGNPRIELFETAKAFRDFVEHADLTIDGDVVVYQSSTDGFAASDELSGTRFWKSGKLNWNSTNR